MQVYVSNDGYFWVIVKELGDGTVHAYQSDVQGVTLNTFPVLLRLSRLTKLV